MNEKVEKERIQKLKGIVQKKEPRETVEQVLIRFCTRSGISRALWKKDADELGFFRISNMKYHE